MNTNEYERLMRQGEAVEAIDSIRAAQESLVRAGGFDGTLDSLDEIVREIRQGVALPTDEDFSCMA